MPRRPFTLEVAAARATGGRGRVTGWRRSVKDPGEGALAAGSRSEGGYFPIATAWAPCTPWVASMSAGTGAGVTYLVNRSM